MAEGQKSQNVMALILKVALKTNNKPHWVMPALKQNLKKNKNLYINVSTITGHYRLSRQTS